MLYRLSILSCLLFIQLTAFGHTTSTVVVDSVTGTPLPRASVFDRHGKLAGIGNDRGELPALSDEDYPITVRFMGYISAIVPQATDRIMLRQSVAELPEMVVKSKKRRILHILGYIREYSMLTTYTDTVMLFSEKSVDFMIPSKKEKKYKGWTKPRLLASASYYHFSNYDGLDSVSNYFGEHFSYADWVGLFKSIDPAPHSKTIDNDTVMGKYKPTSIWNRKGETTHLYIDAMTDSANQRYIPSLSWIIKGNDDIERLDIKYVFDDYWEDSIRTENICRMSFSIESKGRGRNLKRLFHTDSPIYAETYAELYIAGKKYITTGEAKKLEKHPPVSEGADIRPPADAPPLDDEILYLVERVKNIDHDKVHSSLKPDHRIASMKPLQPKVSRWRYFLKSFAF